MGKRVYKRATKDYKAISKLKNYMEEIGEKYSMEDNDIAMLNKSKGKTFDNRLVGILSRYEGAEQSKEIAKKWVYG